MDAAGLAVAVMGCVIKLVVFSTDFVDDAKQVYCQGTTSLNKDLVTVATSIQGATKSLESQLDELDKNVGKGSGGTNNVRYKSVSLSRKPPCTKPSM